MGEIAVGILLHLAHDEFLIERAAIDADAHGLAIVTSYAANRGELLIAAFAGANIAWIDAVFVQSTGTFGVFREQDVTVVVKIADQRRFAPGLEHALLDFGHGRGGFRHVHGDADHFRTGAGEFEALANGGVHIRRVRIGHRLNDDGCASADSHAAHLHSMRLASMRHTIPFLLCTPVIDEVQGFRRR